jgi:tripartite-type tricarboxylate transporter receptor subunit TctC
MNISRRQAMILAAATLAHSKPFAQEMAWPSKPIRIVAGGAGSVTDIRTRWLAVRLSAVLGQPVVVDNNAAAGGNVGAAEVARSASDGYTLLAWHQGIAAINPHLFSKLGFDPLVDLAPITRFGHGPLMLTVPPSLAAQSVKELIALARSRPGALNFGSPGIGTPPHIASEMFKRMAAIDALHVPYRGGGALLAAMLGGQLSWSMDGPTVQVPHVRSGALRALAVTGPQRLPNLPEVPTMAEAGVAGYEYEGWTGYAAPIATPVPILVRLNAEIAKIAATVEAREWFATTGSEAGTMPREAFGDLIRVEHGRFGELVRAAGLRAE